MLIRNFKEIGTRPMCIAFNGVISDFKTVYMVIQYIFDHHPKIKEKKSEVYIFKRMGLFGGNKRIYIVPRTIIKKSAEITKDKDSIGAAKLVCFCNSVGDNPFMAGAYCGYGEAECTLNVGVSGPGVVRAAIESLPKDADLSEVANKIKQTAPQINNKRSSGFS